ncbi:MAG TPA: IS4 family transposase, partial [Thermoanaerobaculia bacterium]
MEREWPYLLSLLPPEAELKKTARSYGAVQRLRAVDKVSTILRLAFVYGFCGFSLRQTAAWAEATEIASLSDVALLKRFRKTPEWLGHLLAIKLAERVTPLPPKASRLRLVDATAISVPGSKGTDWRVHLDFDPAALAISEIQLTQAEGGETFFRFEFDPGELVVADRGYANRPGLAHVMAAGAEFIVRLNSSAVPLQQPGGGEFRLLETVRTLPEAQAQAFDLEIQPDPRKGLAALPVRLVAVRKSEEAAEEARKKALREAAHKGHKLKPETLELAGYVLVLTSTAAADFSPEEILEIYRFRWQIEIVFKRLKSLLQLDEIPAKEPELAQTILFSKLLAALLLEELTQSYL